MKTAGSLVSVAGVENAGAIVWWRLSGVVNVKSFSAAWKAAGLPVDALPAPPTPRAALGRAAQRIATEGGYLARPIDSGWAFVVERRDSERGVSHETIATVSVGPDGAAIVSTFGSVSDDFATRVAIAHEVCRWSWDASALGGWLAEVVLESLDGIALRASGGIYFVPREQVAAYGQLRAIFAANTAHVLHEVPAMRTDEAVEAILASLAEESERAARAIEEAVASGELGARALATRAERAEALSNRLKAYEALLGRSLPELSERLADVRGAVALAVLASEDAA